MKTVLLNISYNHITIINDSNIEQFVSERQIYISETVMPTTMIVYIIVSRDNIHLYYDLFNYSKSLRLNLIIIGKNLPETIKGFCDITIDMKDDNRFSYIELS